MMRLTVGDQIYPFSAFEDDYYWDDEIPACPRCGEALRFEDDECCRIVPVDYRRETGWRMELRCATCGEIQTVDEA